VTSLSQNMSKALETAVSKWCAGTPELDQEAAMTRCKRAFIELVPEADVDKMSTRKLTGDTRKRAKKDAPSYEPVSTRPCHTAR
jgi:hypothetical protein